MNDFSKKIKEVLVEDDRRSVMFSDLFENINEKVVPKDSELTHYIGLGHLDPGSLHIRRFGESKVLKGNKIKIYSGDIIFAKRNAYLKRASVANFDAIASAHSLVLRETCKFTNSGFIKYFMLSQAFWKNAIQISVGSLSPTINWKTIAKQKFLIPSIGQQKKILPLMEVVDDSIEADLRLLYKIDQYRSTFMSLLFLKGNNSKKVKSFSSFEIPEHWDICKMSDISNIEYGISESVANNKDPDIGCQILTGANISLTGGLDLTKKRYIEKPKNKRFDLMVGDLLFNWRSGSPEHIGKTALFDLEGEYTYASFMLRVRCGERIDNIFLHYLLNFLREIEFFTKNISKQVNFKINASVFRDIEIPVPPIEEQQMIILKLQEIDNIKHSLNDKMNSKKILLNSIVNKVF